MGWQQFTETRLQNGIDNIRSWYPKHDHLLAQVTLVNLDYNSGANTVTPLLAISPGPPVLVRLRGDSLPEKLRSLLPIYEERSVDPGLSEEGSRDLASYFQSQGYFDATAGYQIATPANGRELIDYQVALGARHKIVKVEVHGNHYFDDATIRERMSVIPKPHSSVIAMAGTAELHWRDAIWRPSGIFIRANGFRDVERSPPGCSDDYNSAAGHTSRSSSISRKAPSWFVSKASLGRGVSTAQ